MPRGRPVKSDTRQKIVEILNIMGRGYGYEIYKAFTEIFGKTTLRNIYYQLRKGVDLGELKVDKVVSEKGEYSWGGTAEKTYYGLGRYASPSGNADVKKYFEKKKKR